MSFDNKQISVYRSWQLDWCKFARDVLGCYLDKDQEDILHSIQKNRRVSVASGTARGKDFVAAVAGLSFLYLTPKWGKDGSLIENTKVALTAPTGRQIENIMQPEFARLFNNAKKRGAVLPGRLVACDIRTDSDEWFLTGFKADENNHEAWTGFHAVNTMFIVTEASGIPESIFEAIEGNLQGNSRFLLVFNPNKSTGYAAKTFQKKSWDAITLNSLKAPNVVEKKTVIPGQVDYEWVFDKINDRDWCTPILNSEVDVSKDDFEFEDRWYRPEDICRKKILGKFPLVDEDVLIPKVWIDLARERWTSQRPNSCEWEMIGVDVAGMGRDSTVIVDRMDNYVAYIKKHNSGGVADHMRTAGTVKHELDRASNTIASIDTIGEGAGVYSRLVELGLEERVISCKFGNSAKDNRDNELTDITGQYKFANMRAYLFWCVRDWLNPKNNTGAALPPTGTFDEEATNIKWEFRSDGKIIIEPKEEIVKRIGHSTDEFDALANTFHPLNIMKKQDLRGLF